MQKGRVVVAMSGGVDSSVSAALLVEQGYIVTGAFIEAYNEPGCRSDQDKQDALKVAMQLGIRFQTLDVRKAYTEKVIQYFYDEYEAGRTPNPDIVCNREIKFGIFDDYATHNGYDFVATGHYARIVGGRLQRPRDLTKDQTYFLWQVAQDKLEHTLFPLGEMKKQDVRQKARALGLPNADKPDSMGVCMLGEVNVNDFLREKLGEEAGDVVWKGEVVGRHKGLWFHTIGQRGGWEVGRERQSAQMPPLYVIEKHTRQNQLVVGERQKAMRTTWSMVNGQWYMGVGEMQKLIREQKLTIRIRNLGELYEIAEFDRGMIKVKESVFGVAEGQDSVLYARMGGLGDEMIVGGGTIGTCN